ncbi:glycosyltransferase [Shewanella cyperi]|uniref:glycosyltransferase n=1 Tax=Shewanella cyperi TaxID=2814292 RepID=UPI001A93E8EE|nr:glycosyltransferase [Shewanella cyperi]QSX40972.1 glycosyltransferase [Shewanella cyperi]
MSGKRIAIAINSLAGGGAEKVVMTLASSLIAMGHEPHLLVLQNICQHEVAPELKVHYCFGAEERNIDGFWRLSNSVKRVKQWIAGLEAEYGKFDLFLSNLHQTNLMMTRVGVAPLYCVVHNAMEEELKRQRKLGPLAWFEMWRAQQALDGQHLVAVSEGLANELRHSKRIKPASVTTIYNPFELDTIRTLAEQRPADMPEGDYIIHVGRFARQKRHDVLFAALKVMQHQVPLVLLCSNRKKALKAVKKLGLEQRVIIPGFQQNPFPWIKNAKLLVLSSDYEGFGNVLLEALALNTPVVSTDCPHGPDEILGDALAHCLVPRRDPQALAAAMDRVLTQGVSLEQLPILDAVGAEHVAQQYLALAK